VERPLGDIPLVVLSGGRGTEQQAGAQEEQIQQIERELHEEQARLSSRGRRLPVPGSGHNIALEQPQWVVEAVREVVAAVRQEHRARQGRRRPQPLR
jgi:pimeloyl-ACP methyl ester carboxylesterase